ncbi:MAG TPA: glycosyltransferase family 39 protein, partial [Phycisphaerae bacterium]
THAWALLILIEFVAVLLHLPALRQPHYEGDEVIFTFMAERVRQHPLRYTLQGPLTGAAAKRFIEDTWMAAALTGARPANHAQIRAEFEALDEAQVLYRPFEAARKQYAYDPHVYDRRFFFHPPLYVCSLALMRCLFGTVGGPLLSTLAHAATVALLFLLGRALADIRIGLLAAALVALEPISFLCGHRAWIDALLEMWIVAAFVAAVGALRTGRATHAALAGLVLGLAGLTKLPAALVMPGLVAAALVAPRRPGWQQALAFIAGVAVLMVPWLGITKWRYGAFLPDAYPTQWLMEHYPFVRMVVGRPWHFYLTGLLLVAPVFVYCIPALVKLRNWTWLWIPTVWAAGVMAVLTVMGVSGQGLQLRYLAPAMPALCLLAAAGVLYVRWWWSMPAIALGAVTCVSLAAAGMPGNAEPAPLFLMWYLQQVGVEVLKALADLWIPSG